MRAVVILALLAGSTAFAAPPTSCGSTEPYGVALCAYQHRDFTAAQAGFRAIVDANEPDPVTLRATYFLARTEMKLGRWEEAEPLFIRIYEMSRAFYDDWDCDYLLGICRRAEGKGE